MKERTKRILRTTFNIVKAIAVVAAPHTFIATVAKVVAAYEAADEQCRKSK